MKDVSDRHQLVVTTHNPEVIRHAGQDNVFLIGRNDKGFSSISKPVKKKNVQDFLKNDIGLADLYVQDLLRV